MIHFFCPFSTVGDRAFYFMGELAELQQNLLSHFATQISEQGFVPMKAPDFCKDFVIVRTKKQQHGIVLDFKLT